MVRAKALVVGVPRPGPQSGWRADFLPGVDNDVADMTDFFRRRGFDVVQLFNTQATAKAVLDQIRHAAGELTQAGDFFAFYYSGHGAEQRGVQSDEANDQLLLTYDQPIVDNQLGALWPSFAKDARVVVVTDSCHSETNVRKLLRTRDLQDLDAASILSIGLDGAPTGDHQTLRDVPKIKDLRCTLLHLSACRDNAKAFEHGSMENGAFTGELLSIFGAGFKGSYVDLIRRIRQRTVSFQFPSLCRYGTPTRRDAMRNQRAFDVRAAWPPA